MPSCSQVQVDGCAPRRSLEGGDEKWYGRRERRKRNEGFERCVLAVTVLVANDRNDLGDPFGVICDASGRVSGARCVPFQVVQYHDHCSATTLFSQRWLLEGDGTSFRSIDKYKLF